MGARLAVAVLLAAIGSAQAPPPMFRPWYGEALRDIYELEATDAARLERQLAANPEDFRARLKLLAYHHRADRIGRPEDRAERVRLTFWLIEHHPDSEILHSPFTRFLPGELNSVEFRRAVAFWERASRNAPGQAVITWNAASFFEGLDPGLHLGYLEITAAADPNHPYAIRPLAHLYALSLLDGGPLAARARAGLESSNNHWVLGNAAYMLQSQYNQDLQMGRPNPQAAELAERYFLRAKALNPALDRNAILPRIDLAAIARE
jgi:hypothetical protein